jgi:hypothetical protein
VSESNNLSHHRRRPARKESLKHCGKRAPKGGHVGDLERGGETATMQPRDVTIWHWLLRGTEPLGLHFLDNLGPGSSASVCELEVEESPPAFVRKIVTPAGSGSSPHLGNSDLRYLGCRASDTARGC